MMSSERKQYDQWSRQKSLLERAQNKGQSSVIEVIYRGFGNQDFY